MTNAPAIAHYHPAGLEHQGQARSFELGLDGAGVFLGVRRQLILVRDAQTAPDIDVFQGNPGPSRSATIRFKDRTASTKGGISEIWDPMCEEMPTGTRCSAFLISS